MTTPSSPRATSALVFALLLVALVACASPSKPLDPVTTPPVLADLGDTWVRSADTAVMVYVPAGEFIMGSTAGEKDEGPVHKVELDGFWIDRTEVTNAQYKKCVEAGACQAPIVCEWGKPTFKDASLADHPVVCVDWHGAAAYCKWAGAQLPTEAQWEYAARGPQDLTFPWGEKFDCSRGSFDDETWIHPYVVPGGEGCDGFEKTAPAGSFPAGASWCDAMDLAGNVSEWVADWYGSYTSEAQSNPYGPVEGGFKVLRGSAWITFQGGERSTLRYKDIPDSRNRNAGFRCAISLTADSP